MAPLHRHQLLWPWRWAGLLFAMMLPASMRAASAEAEIAGPAATGAMVAMLERVQPPAWVLHEGGRTPAKPALALYAGDRIQTGDQGHVVLVLGQYGRLSLGSQSQLVLQDGAIDSEARMPMTLALTAGAASYTAPSATAPLSTPVLQVGAQLRARAVTGRVWMHVDEQGVARLGVFSGTAQLQAGEGSPITLDAPGEELVVDTDVRHSWTGLRGEAERAIWAQAVSSNAERPVLVAEGAWAVATPLLRRREDAEQTSCRFQALGYPVELHVLSGHAGTRYRLELSGLLSPRDAARLRDQLLQDGMRGARVAAARPEGQVQHCPQPYLSQAVLTPPVRDEARPLRPDDAWKGNPQTNGGKNDPGPPGRSADRGEASG